MSFRSEAAKVRSNIAAGNYKEPRDYFAGFADQIASGIRRQDEAKRQEEIEKRREARAEARAIAAAQRKEDAKAKEQERLINGYLTVKGYDATEANKAAIRTVVTDLGITGFADLDAIMQQSSSYVEGTPQADIDQQMNDLSLLQQGDGPFKSEQERVSKLSTEGKIEFGKTRGKNPLEMTLDEVRFELSDTTISGERRALLERRKKSLTDPETYTPTTLYKADGSEVIARTEKEENAYLAQGFSLVKGAEPAEYTKRTMYKEGAEVEVFNQAEEDDYTGDGWSREKPKDPVEFKQRTVYKAETGEEQEVFSQEDFDSAIADGFSAIKPAKKEDFQARTLYLEGAEVKVFSEAEEKEYTNQGWSRQKPATPEKFVTRTLYAEDGREQVVTNQTEMDAAIEGGFSAIKPAQEDTFKQRTLYMDGAEVQVFSAEEEEAYVEQGWSREKPAKEEGFKKRTLYNDSGAQVEVFTQAEMDKYQAEGFVAVKPAADKPFQSRTMYKGNQEVRVFSNEEYVGYLKKGFGSVKTNTEKYTARTYYKDGQEIRVLSADQQAKLENEGWGPIKLDDVAQIMADLKVDRSTAAQIKNGTLKITSDGFGRPIIVDISTQQQINISGSETVGDASKRINAENLTPEEQEELNAAAKEAEEALKAAGFEGRIDELNDVSAAFGPEGFTGKILNVLGGLVGTTPMEDAAEATSVVNALNKVTKFNIISGFAGLRDSVSLKAEIETLLPTPGRLKIGKPDALRRFRDIKALLDQAVILQQNTANATNVNTAAVSKANVALNSLRPLAQLYGTIVENIEGEQNAPAGVTDSVFKNTGGTNTTDQSLPVVSGTDDPKFKNLKAGEKFIYNGDTYTKN